VNQQERRKHRRLDLKLDVYCRKVGSASENLLTAEAVNISTSGVLLETEHFEDNDHGQLFNLELDIDSEDVSLDFSRRFSSFARVVRISDLPDSSRDTKRKKQIALEFCTAPKLEL